MEWWREQTAIDKVRLIDKYEIKTERINSLDISEINVMKIYDAELPEEKVSQSIEDYLGAKYKDELVRIDALEDIKFGINWQCQEDISNSWTKGCECKDSIGQTWCCNQCGLPYDTRKSKRYTEEDIINIVKKSRETGLTAEYLILQLNKQDK